MSTPGMQPQPSKKSETASISRMRLGEMPGVPSSVSFDSSGGATIDIGAVESTVTSVEVKWGGESVYSSTTPNASGQTAISVSAASGSVYSLQLLVLYANWTRPSIYSASITANPSSRATQTLPRTQTGGV